MRRNVFVLLVLLVSYAASAQQKGLPLTGSVQVGLLEGERGSAFQMAMMGGVKLNGWITSIGTGLDYYSIRSIPLYLNVQRNILSKAQTPFVYASGGYHFLWLTDAQRNSWDIWGTDLDKSGGLYLNAGVGYQLPAFNNTQLYFSAGYSQKNYKEELSTTYPCLVAPCPVYKETYNFQFRRLSVTTGLRF